MTTTGRPSSTEKNLNKVSLESDGNYPDWIRKEGAASKDIEVYFDRLEERLVQHIERAEICLGCVAWLTSENIIKALAKKKIVSIVVQKEDFLRPDIGIQRDSMAHYLRALYSSLPRGISQNDVMDSPGQEMRFPGQKLKQVSACWAWETGAIRCVGNYNADKSPAFPRMHHKFLLFCDGRGKPYAVWTGSFNFTKNAGMSLENALYITDPAVTSAYGEEWAYVFALSEPLDWTKKWIEPQLRVGT